ncbi:MAG TPA: HAD-IA family hydrolase, partial [Usitatibacteraceae bacterium]|nr:HAD-IA family hydrolase [Usitatibacteraceae bacterium]
MSDVDDLQTATGDNADREDPVIPSPASADAGATDASADVVRKPRLRAKPKFPFPIRARAVLLDLDGTLLDTAGDIATAANLMRQSLGFAPLDPALIRTFVGKGISNLVGKTLKDAVGEVGPTALQVAVANFERQYEKCFGDTSVPFPGVLDGLAALKAKGLRLGCVTNKAEKFTLPLLDRCGLAAHFELVICGDTLAAKKPDPLPLTHAAERLAIAPAEMVLIGDSVNDA